MSEKVCTDAVKNALKLQVNNLLAQEPAPLIHIDGKICLALLARLEAAERLHEIAMELYADIFKNIVDAEKHFQNWKKLEKADEAWRKAAGK